MGKLAVGIGAAILMIGAMPASCLAQSGDVENMPSACKPLVGANASSNHQVDLCRAVILDIARQNPNVLFEKLDQAMHGCPKGPAGFVQDRIDTYKIIFPSDISTAEEAAIVEFDMKCMESEPGEVELRLFEPCRR